MTPLEQLREKARVKRDKAIHKARQEYRVTVAEIRSMARRLGCRLPSNIPRQSKSDHGGDYSKMTVRQAAESVLLDAGPLTMTELTLEVMQRGCRSDDSPRAVAHAIDGVFRYHVERFSRDEEGRWVAKLAVSGEGKLR